jgi:mRNA interferase MazF
LSDYIPDAGDIISLDFDPRKGHDQVGERPAIVLSVRDLNKAYGVCLCCPMTTKLRGTPNEVPIPGVKPSVAISTMLKPLILLPVT